MPYRLPGCAITRSTGQSSYGSRYRRDNSRLFPHSGQVSPGEDAPLSLAPQMTHACTGFLLNDCAVRIHSPPGNGQQKRASPLRLTLCFLRLPVTQPKSPLRSPLSRCPINQDGAGQPVL